MASSASTSAFSYPAQLAHWAARVGLSNKLAVLLTVAAIISGLVTYGSITGALAPLGPDPESISVLLIIDVVLTLLLAVSVVRRLVRLWIERRQGQVGSRLHTRLVALFAMIAVTPAITVAVFFVIYFTFGLQAWFSERVSTALDEAKAIATSYLHDHQQFVGADILSMAGMINRLGPGLLTSPEGFDRLLDNLVVERSLSEAIVLRGNGTVLARSRLSAVLEFDLPSFTAMERARDGEVLIFTSEESDRVRALTRLDNIVGAFLYGGRFLDPKALNHVARVSSVHEDYRQLESERSEFQLIFTILIVVVALLLLLAAVWIGLAVANQLVRPISALVGAAEKVRSGDLSIRVSEDSAGDELSTLSRAFNRMTDQLQSQRGELIEANRQLDERRRFTEAVLFGVSAGVLGLDPQGRVFLPNRSALDLLSCEYSDLAGRPLHEAVPEMGPLMETIRRDRSRIVQDQVTIVRKARARTLSVRVTTEGHGQTQGVTGYVVTFDDVTELISAQRAAAWTDVARRIAHEIKNPLTPIQLSAERLKRKFSKQLADDTDIFVSCTDTIVRQVADIRRMVDEFSAFARMPAPVRAQENISELARSGLSMQQWARPEIEFEYRLPDAAVIIYCDARQVAQALTNLLQNAVDAIHGRAIRKGETLPPGHIVVEVSRDDDGTASISVRDNGRGLPAEKRDRLTEPYVTTRSKGTGLGLAIVKKIMEDHGGTLELADEPDGGACVSLLFPDDFAPAADDQTGSETVREERQNDV